MDRKDPLRNFRFRVKIDGIRQARSGEVTGSDATVEPIDYREGTDPPPVSKPTGLTKYDNVTLKGRAEKGGKRGGGAKKGGSK